MSTLSSAERGFVCEGVRLNVRQDGRTRLQSRPITLQTSLLQTAHGSARARLLGTDGTTEVLAIVTAELESVGTGSSSSSPATTGSVEIHVDCGALSGAMRGDSDSQLASFLSDILLAPDAFDRRQLCVREGEGTSPRGRALFCWNLSLDINVHTRGAGNVRDVAMVAAMAALEDTALPYVRIIGVGKGMGALEEGDDGAVQGEEGEDFSLRGLEGQGPEFEVDDDPARCVRLDTSSVPLCMTMAHIFASEDGSGKGNGKETGDEGRAGPSGGGGAEHVSSPSLSFPLHEGWFVLDPSGSEERCSASLVTVAVGRNGDILSIQKSHGTGGGSGGGSGSIQGIDPVLLFSMVRHIVTKAGDVFKKFDSTIKSDLMNRVSDVSLLDAPPAAAAAELGNDNKGTGGRNTAMRETKEDEEAMDMTRIRELAHTALMAGLEPSSSRGFLV